MTPAIERALTWLRAGHLGQPDMAGQEPDRDRRAREILAACQAFPGVMETVLAMTIERPPVDHRLPEGEYLRYAQLREGQNQVAAGLLNYIDHALTLERTDRERRQSQSEPGTDSRSEPWSPPDLTGDWTALR